MRFMGESAKIFSQRKMNTLENLESSLLNKDNVILVPPELCAKAHVSLGRMIDFCS